MCKQQATDVSAKSKFIFPPEKSKESVDKRDINKKRKAREKKSLKMLGRSANIFIYSGVSAYALAMETHKQNRANEGNEREGTKP